MHAVYIALTRNKHMCICVAFTKLHPPCFLFSSNSLMRYRVNFPVAVLRTWNVCKFLALTSAIHKCTLLPWALWEDCGGKSYFRWWIVAILCERTWGLFLLHICHSWSESVQLTVRKLKHAFINAINANESINTSVWNALKKKKGKAISVT